MGEDCAGLRLDQALARLLPEYSRSRLSRWIRQGAVRVDGALRAAKERVWGGETVEVALQPDPQETAYTPEERPLAVVYEDKEIIVLDKPAGLVVHPGSGNWRGTLLNALLHHAPALAALPRAGIVHRLDKDTSGLMVVAKTLAAHVQLQRALAERRVRREYLAFALGTVPGSCTIEAPIGRHPVRRTRMAVVDPGKPALTHVQALEPLPGCTLVLCRLETGRTHQIRVHLHSIGHALVGDPVYRGTPKGPAAALLAAFPRQALHAARLVVPHPAGGRPLVLDAPLPADMAALLDQLRRHP
ncbi:RluA family pseudouridine synthase [Pelomicrobium sp.]|uniref:RluA family pseudouridine synthase n=1 Tax=Pelomicrobium sp. TaxID=2815319 RepID=UPI002FDE6D60